MIASFLEHFSGHDVPPYEGFLTNLLPGYF
jgi:hypothetical protein